MTTNGQGFVLNLPEHFEPGVSTEKSLAIPLKVGETVLGQLSIKKRIAGGFTERDTRMLHILADYSSIAIHNMQLLHRLQRSKEEEKQRVARSKSMKTIGIGVGVLAIVGIGTVILYKTLKKEKY